MYLLFVKRLIDFFLSFIAFILVFPCFIIITFLLLFSNKGKPFFLQKRPGKNEKLFSIIKFKTMNDEKNKNGELLPFDQRITKVGAFIRKYSLDEIPQLINVFKGDMSLIGPRPLLIEYLPLYSEKQKQRHNVRPGITGWAQVNGRNTILWVRKFEYDIWYVENISFMLDLKILFLTIKKVIIKEGVNLSETLNMTTFSGGKNE
jgi:undecaprenyl phosphate N,N'-diacetylbacillosamine 1-phosphate transferase